jgi:hypothetical protein
VGVAAVGDRRGGAGQLASVLISARLRANTACPHQIAAPWRPSRRVRSPVAAFEVADPSFAAGAPFDELAETAAVLNRAAGG